MRITDARLIAVVACALAAIVFGASTAHATDVFFGNIEATSDNGRYRFEARSPENNGKERRAFQRDFRYALVDTTTGKELWSRRQEKELEPSPVGAWVRNDGVVVVESGWSDFAVYPVDSAVPRGSHNFLRLLPKSESEQFVHQTSAGPMWHQGRLVFFADHDGASLFVVRAWWGRRLVIDLASGKLVLEDPPLKATLAARERDLVLSTLRRITVECAKEGDARPERRDWKFSFDSIGAATFAGIEQVKESVPLLRMLEKCDHSGKSTFGGTWILETFPSGSINPSNHRTLGVRLAAQVALRRLGERPAPLPAFQFDFVDNSSSRRRPVQIQLNKPREEMVGAVKPGMSPLDVLSTVGAPDMVSGANRLCVWEYDIDTDPPYTLLLSWDRAVPPKLLSVEREQPPRWMDPLGPRTEEGF